MDTTNKNISDDNMMANVANTDSELLKVWNYFKTQSNPVPNYLKNVLNIMGYDNIALISKIDIKEIEEFVRTDLHKFISESDDPCEFYGPVFGKASMSKNEFIIVPGHRRLLEEVIKYCSDIIIDLNANSSEPHCRDRNSKEIATAKMKLSVPAIEFNPTSSARNSPQPQPSSHYFFKEEHAIIKDTPAENQVAVPVDPQHHTEAALPVGQSAAQLYQLPQNLRNSVQPRNQTANQGPPLKCMAPIGPPTKGSLRSNSNIMARQHFQQQQRGYSLTNQAPYVGNQSPEGKKVYDRDFLIQLRDHPNSKIKPDNIPDVILAGFDSSKIGDFGRWGIHTPVKYNKFKMP